MSWYLYVNNGYIDLGQDWSSLITVYKKSENGNVLIGFHKNSEKEILNSADGKIEFKGLINQETYKHASSINLCIRTFLNELTLSNGNYRIIQNTTKNLNIETDKEQKDDEYDKNYIYNMIINEGVNLTIPKSYYLGIGKNHQSNFTNDYNIVNKYSNVKFENKGTISGIVCIGCTSYIWDDRTLISGGTENNKSDNDGINKYNNHLSYFNKVEVDFGNENNDCEIFIGCNFLRYKDFLNSSIVDENDEEYQNKLMRELIIEECGIKNIITNRNIHIACGYGYIHEDIDKPMTSYVNKSKECENKLYIKKLTCDNTTSQNFNIFCFGDEINRHKYIECHTSKITNIKNKDLYKGEFNQFIRFHLTWPDVGGGEWNRIYINRCETGNITFPTIKCFDKLQGLHLLTSDIDKEETIIAKTEYYNFYSSDVYLPVYMKIRGDYTEQYYAAITYSDETSKESSNIQNWHYDDNIRTFEVSPEFTLKKQRYKFVFSENINPDESIFYKNLVLKVPDNDIFYKDDNSNPSISLEIKGNDHSGITENLIKCVDIKYDNPTDPDPKRKLRNIPKILKCLFVLYLMTENDREFLNLLVILIIHFYRMYKKIYTGVDHRINMILLYIWNEVDDIFNPLKPYYNASVDFSNNNLISNSQNYYQSFYLIK